MSISSLLRCVGFDEVATLTFKKHLLDPSRSSFRSGLSPNEVLWSDVQTAFRDTLGREAEAGLYPSLDPQNSLTRKVELDSIGDILLGRWRMYVEPADEQGTKTMNFCDKKNCFEKTIYSNS